MFLNSICHDAGILIKTLNRCYMNDTACLRKVGTPLKKLFPVKLQTCGYTKCLWIACKGRTRFCKWTQCNTVVLLQCQVVVSGELVRKFSPYIAIEVHIFKR